MTRPGGSLRRTRIAADANRRAATAGSPEPDLRAAVSLVLELLPIPGPSRQEGQIAQAVVERLRHAGAPASALAFDRAHERTTPRGEVGNLVFKLPGTLPGPRRLLMAHLDTVPLCVGSRPLRRGNLVRSGRPDTGLGADNRAGCAVLVTAAREILTRGLPHPPLTFVWCVQEEIGLFGARHAQLGVWGKPRLGFNWDGGPADKLTVGATGAYRLAIELVGQAAHAGGAPEKGISAITVAGLALADLHQRGWLGLVALGTHSGTSNFGTIEGGQATNVVTPLVRMRAEARSHDPRFRLRMVREIERALARAARAVRSIDGAHGQAKVTSQLDYESFRLAADEPCVLAAEAAVRSVGGEPLRAISNGGLDANWTTAHGLPTVTLGCGQRNVHTPAEELDLEQFQQACRVALRLATGIA